MLGLGRNCGSAAGRISGANPPRVADSDGGDGNRIADRVCEHRQSTAGKEFGARKRNGGSGITRGGTMADYSPAPDRKPAAVVIGCALGLGFGELGVVAIRGLHAVILPRVGKVEFDSSVLWLTLGSRCLRACCSDSRRRSTFPGRGCTTRLKKRVGEGSGGRRGQRTRNALVISEIAFSLLLVTGAGLTIRSFYRFFALTPASVRTIS